jgi:hypothetical protein
MDYGFVVPGNEYDRVALRFDIELVKVRARHEASGLFFSCVQALGLLSVGVLRVLVRKASYTRTCSARQRLLPAHGLRFCGVWQ